FCLFPNVRSRRRLMNLKCEEPGRDGQPRTGTWRGYQAHRRAGEPTCQECRQAAVRNTVERRKRNPAYDERQRERDRRRKRERYATDPDYRAALRAKRTKRRKERYRSDPEYREK